MGHSLYDKIIILIIVILRNLLRPFLFINCFVRWRCKILDNLSKRLCVSISGITYLVPDYHAFWILDPQSEDFLMEVLTLRDGEIFLDVGAHIGKYALLIASKCPRSLVIAVEPSPINFLYLLKNIRRNKLHNIIPLNIAAYSSQEELKFYVEGPSTSHRIAHNGTVKVRARPLDRVLHELGVYEVHLIKVDVEGAELQVLKGLQATLRRGCRLVVEVNKENLTHFIKFMKSLGYKIKVLRIIDDRCYYLYCYRF